MGNTPFGICYGAQFISYSNGGRVEPAGTREYGRAHLGSFDSENVLFKGVRKNTQVWMSHGDTITAIPDNFKIIASTDKVAIAAYQVSGEEMWGVQFHPEVFHSEDGTQMLRNFVVDVCGCSELERRIVCRYYCGRTEGAAWQRPSYPGTEWRCGFFGSRCVAASCHWQELDLYLCGPRTASQE